MLVNMHVKNLAIIDEIEVDFGDNLNILTGETGAGKSILIDSINLALGGKVSPGMIRKGKEQALVELTFHVKDEGTLDKLKSLDIPMEDSMVIISRRIRSSRSISRVNGESVTNQVLKTIAGLLIDIHGQHEHQSLLYKSKHLEILDQFAKDEIQHLTNNIKNSYDKYIQCKKDMEKYTLPEEERLRELSFMEYEKQQIEDARLKTGEDLELEQRFRTMSNGSSITESLGSVYEITGGENGIGDELGRSLRQFGRMRELDTRLGDFEEQLRNIDSLLNDFNREIKDYLDQLEFDPAEYIQTGERLNLIHTLKSKYGGSIEAVQCYYEELAEKMKKFADHENFMEELKKKLEKSEKKLEEDCKKLSCVRRKKASLLEHSIKKALTELNFFNVDFAIEFRRLSQYTAKGFDEIEFLISTNPGEDLKPLGKVASGGELSRIMLAIKSVLADKDAVDTLIFDEIDTGISGRTAQKVSERLSAIAKSHQVISITHLPQIASMAKEHFIIEKTSDGVTTATHISSLDFNASVTELARMLGGARITDAVMASAKEMKEMALKICQNKS